MSKRVSCKKLINTIITFLADNIPDMPRFFKTMFMISFEVESNVKPWAKALMSALATITTGISLLILAKHSFIGVGAVYFLCAIGCNAAVGIVNAGGSWFHLFTGVLYELCTGLKEDLFANFLSTLQGSFFLKALQIFLLILCFVAISALLYVFCICFKTFIMSAITMGDSKSDPPSKPSKPNSKSRPNSKSPKITTIRL